MTFSVERSKFDDKMIILFVVFYFYFFIVNQRRSDHPVPLRCSFSLFALNSSCLRLTSPPVSISLSRLRAPDTVYDHECWRAPC